MGFMDLVKERRSIRKYIDKPVEREKIEKCLEAARLAPSACNAQPWKFVVVDEPALKERVFNGAFSGMYKRNMFTKEAGAFIVVVSEKQVFVEKLGQYLKGTDYYLTDIGIACEHFILQATELGLGTCWLGWFNEKAVKKVLDIPRSRRVDIIISLGYFEKGDLPDKGRKPIREISNYNSYK